MCAKPSSQKHKSHVQGGQIKSAQRPEFTSIALMTAAAPAKKALDELDQVPNTGDQHTIQSYISRWNFYSETSEDWPHDVGIPRFVQTTDTCFKSYPATCYKEKPVTYVKADFTLSHNSALPPEPGLRAMSVDATWDIGGVFPKSEGTPCKWNWGRSMVPK